MSKMAAGQIQSIYATPEDFCAIFEENMEHLYSLALLLTGDPAIAEQCFLAALGDCQNRPNVFPEWARSWSRRSIIQQAIRRMHPVGALRETDATCEGYADLDTPTRLARLSLFERFVFAMTVLEGYSVRECAVLLNCDPREVEQTRIQALRRTAGLNPALATAPRGSGTQVQSTVAVNAA